LSEPSQKPFLTLTPPFVHPILSAAETDLITWPSTKISRRSDQIPRIGFCRIRFCVQNQLRSSFCRHNPISILGSESTFESTSESATESATLTPPIVQTFGTPIHFNYSQPTQYQVRAFFSTRAICQVSACVLYLMHLTNYNPTVFKLSASIIERSCCLANVQLPFTKCDCCSIVCSTSLHGLNANSLFLVTKTRCLAAARAVRFFMVTIKFRRYISAPEVSAFVHSVMLPTLRYPGALFIIRSSI